MTMVILNDQGGNVMSFSDSVVSTLRAESHQHEPVVCLRIQEKRNHEISDGVKCMTPWDYQGKRIYQTNGVYPTLYAADNSGQQTHGVCYAIEWHGSRPSHLGNGYSDAEMMYTLNTIETHAVCYAIDRNVVDRVAAQNGKGWCENVSPTLNTQDRHAVVFEGVCYGISRSALKGGEGSTGGIPVEKDIQPTITANGCGAVAYAVENHPMDCRVTMDDSGVIQTLSARMGTGGNNVPLVLMAEEDEA